MLAVLVVGPMVGSEFAVAAFLHPIAARLPDHAFRAARSDGARVLGRVMPYWYLTSLALLVVAALVAGPQRWLFGIGVAVMAAVVLMTVAVMVPINNRIAAGDVSPRLVTRWDRLHWLRVTLLAALFALLVIGVLRTPR
ncbi:anthrone oxygenase family protein [Mycobacterium sp. pUA109]|uniref:anthrone oxygenase family protein n=1 Tax=Mycobacterium sp. pUA109 TaxID=3238982 RepID=UPI00351ABDD4